MKIAHKPGELHGARFRRAGNLYVVLGSATPDGHVVAIGFNAQEPAPVFLLAVPKPEEIDSITPVRPEELQRGSRL